MLQTHATSASSKLTTLGMKLNRDNTATYNIGTQLYPIILVVCKNPLIFHQPQTNTYILLSSSFPFTVSTIHPINTHIKIVLKTVSVLSGAFKANTLFPIKKKILTVKKL
jgi:hypothetical protein